MPYLPTLCDHCSRPRLVPIADVTDGAARCPDCNGEARIVPSRSYPAADLDLFDELSEGVSSGMSAATAQQLAARVGHILWSGSSTSAFNDLMERWPGLFTLQTAIGGNAQAQRRVLQLLSTIFAALAMLRPGMPVSSHDQEERSEPRTVAPSR